MSVYSFFEEACTSSSLTNATNNCLELFQGSKDLINLCFSACEEAEQLKLASVIVSSLFVVCLFIDRSMRTAPRNPFESFGKIPVFSTDEKDEDEDFLSLLPVF